MGTRALALLVAILAGVPAHAQTTDGDFDKALSPSLAGVAKAMHSTIRTNLAEGAEQMSEADYAFRPSPEVRTFGQLVGHIATANFFLCSQAVGEKSPATTNFESLTDRAELLRALQDSLSYCDRVYRETTDANFSQPVTVRGTSSTATVRGAVLQFNVAHNNEHYGNVVVYMRLRGKVPPSTARVQNPR